VPLVVSRKSRSVTFVENDDFLGEILGHSNFDGYDWAIGDLLVFEDGTGALIEKNSRDDFHVWSDQRLLRLPDVVGEVRSFGDSRLSTVDDISSWPLLFEKLSAPLPRTSIWRRLFRRP
jgi:hypothetical protein